jgi:hypothetical protein
VRIVLAGDGLGTRDVHAGSVNHSIPRRT